LEGIRIISPIFSEDKVISKFPSLKGITALRNLKCFYGYGQHFHRIFHKIDLQAISDTCGRIVFEEWDAKDLYDFAKQSSSKIAKCLRILKSTDNICVNGFEYVGDDLDPKWDQFRSFFIQLDQLAELREEGTW